MTAGNRRWVASVLFVCLFALSACRESESEPGPEARDEYVVKIMTLEPVPFKRSDESKIGRVVKEKFNIVFEYVQAPGNYANKLSLMLAAGDYPELITIQDNDTFDKYVRAGALLPLEEFVRDTPAFAERYRRQIPLWRISAYDGRLYKWEGAVPIEFDNKLDTNDVGVRIDALEQQGWPQLRSTDDYIAFLKQALRDNPTTNGQPTLGMVAPFAESWGMQGIAGIMYEKGGRYSSAAGNQGVVWNQVAGEFEDMMKNEYVKESLQFFNRLYREGILDKESFTDKMDQVNEKLSSGRVLSVWYSVWGLPAVNHQLMEAGSSELQYINLPIRSMTQMERNEKRQIRVEDTRPFEIWAITRNARHPERILELLAWAVSEEGRILLQSGLEGEEYTLQDGKRVPTESYRKIITDPIGGTRIGFGLFNFLGDVHSNAPDGAPYSLGLDPVLREQLFLTPETKRAYRQLGWENSRQYYLETGEAAHTGVAGTISIDTTSELGALHAEIVDFRTRSFAHLIATPTSDTEFEALYREVLADYEQLNPERIVEEYNRLYREKNDILSKLQ